MATTDPDDEIERVTDPDETHVLVTAQHRYETFHRIGPDGTPPCAANGNDDPDNWEEWDVETAEVWTDPCQFEQCYGGDG